MPRIQAEESASPWSENSIAEGNTTLDIPTLEDFWVEPGPGTDNPFVTASYHLFPQGDTDRSGVLVFEQLIQPASPSIPAAWVEIARFTDFRYGTSAYFQPEVTTPPRTFRLRFESAENCGPGHTVSADFYVSYDDPGMLG